MSAAMPTAMPAAMPAATFKLGALPLPLAEATLARAICDEACITPSQLYCKWEAWAVVHAQDAHLPSVSHLRLLAAHIRSTTAPTTTPTTATKVAATAAATAAATVHQPAHARSPGSPATPNHAASAVYAAGPVPTRINVDDFFSYFDAEPYQHDTTPANPSADRMDVDATATAADRDDHHHPHDDHDDLVLAGAAVGRPRAIALPTDAQPDSAYAARDASGRVEASFNPRDAATSAPASASASASAATLARSSISVRPLAPPPAVAPRYMNDAVPDRIEAVRARVRDMGERILARMRAARGEYAAGDAAPRLAPQSFFVPSPDVVLAVGRVRVELDGSDGVTAGCINPSSVMLESEDGNLLKLNLARLHEHKLPLFLNPGMVVVVEGVNTNGRCMQVHAIYDNAMALPPDERAGKAKVTMTGVDDGDDDVAGVDNDDDDDDEILPEGRQEPDAEPFANLVLAAGPFTTSANLKYEPLDDLLDVVKRSRPDVVMLAGPFVDAAHEQITAATPVPFEQIFETRVMTPLRQAIASMAADASASSPSPHLILIPSLSDVHHDFVCPQPAFRLRDGQAADAGVTNITMLPNPCVVELTARNGASVASIGMSSLPGLQDISGDSLCWNKGDRFSAIASHMLRQRSFYPSFPPPPSVPLDCSLMDGLAIPDIERSPTIDVLVTPSRLKAFIKSVDGGAVAVNPGVLCRGSSGGTFAELRVPLHDAKKQRPLNANADNLQGNIVRL